MLTQSEIDAMRIVQIDAMMDKCEIYPFLSWKMNKEGDQTDKNFGTMFETVCGLEPTFLQSKGGAVKTEYIENIQYDAVIRLPWNVEIKPMDEIVITERFMTEIDGKRYEVTKAEAAGVSGKRVMVTAK